jgi:hypothetical protein
MARDSTARFLGMFATRRFILLAVAALASCTNQLAQRQAYLSQFIGKPESALVQQMGVPNRSYETGGVKYLAYDEHRIDIVPGPPTYAPFYLGWYGAGFPPQVVELTCETTFEISAGTVKTFTLRGNACG